MSLSITLKTTAIGLFIALIVVIGMTVVLNNTMHAESAVRQLTDDVLVQQIESEHYNLHVQNLFSHARSFAQAPTSQQALLIDDELKQAQVALDKLKLLLAPDDEFDTDILDERVHLLARRTQLLSEINQTSRQLRQTLSQASPADRSSSLGQLEALASIAQELELDSDKMLDQAIGETSTSAFGAMRRVELSVITVLGVLIALLLITVFQVWRTIARPIVQLAHAVKSLAGGELHTSVAVTNRDEIGVLQHSFNQTSLALRQADERVAEQQRLLEQRVAERTAELRQTLDELQTANQAEAELRSTIRDLSVPIVPILDGILVMPLIGLIDSGRAQSIISALLHGIEQHKARTVFLDVTGVPIIDSQIAQVLIHAASSARLLGAETVLVGLRPELAQTIVGLGVELSGVKTRADLQSGVRAALARMPRSA